MNPRRIPSRGRRRGFAAPLAIGALVVAVIVGGIVLSIARVNTVTTYEACTVTEKEDRALASIDKREPRIYTDCGVFVIADEPFRFHFAAADVYNAVQEGQTYDLTTIGWRFGLFSWFPNITEAKG